MFVSTRLIVNIQLGIKLKISDTDHTLAVYPYHFSIELQARLKENRLEIIIIIHNLSTIPMPFSFGLHPYFKVADLTQIQIKGLSKDCTNHINMKNDKTEKQMQKINEGIDFLTGPSKVIKIIDLMNGSLIELEQEKPMDLTVIWSEPPRPMICVEPWTSPRQSLISGDRKLDIAANSSFRLKASISYDRF